MAQFHLYQKEKELPVNSGSTRQRVEDVNISHANLGEQDFVSCFFLLLKKKKNIPPIL